jgi:ABC-type antimicrobial peptide transport system ATPase subunit
MIFKSDFLKIKCVFDFLYKFTLNISRCVNNQRDIIVNVHRSSCKAPSYSCHFLIKLEFSKNLQI